MMHKLILTDPELLLLQAALHHYPYRPRDIVDSLSVKVEHLIDKSGLEKPNAMKYIVKMTN